MKSFAHWTKDEFKMLYLGLAAVTSFISYIMVIMVAIGWVMLSIAWNHKPKVVDDGNP